jgi:membrane-associated HD superfamily phosphohydrolase
MPEPTPGRIRDTVDRVIQKRLMDGQFDECDLTFRELDLIRESLVKSLNSIYHGRITYPSSEKPAEPRTAS